MAEKHDQMLAHYRARLVKKKFRIERKSPFVDYRPDIYATQNKQKLFVEVEIEKTLHSNHTLHQLEIMYQYLQKSKKHAGVLVVPRKVREAAELLIDSVFGDYKISVDVA